MEYEMAADNSSSARRKKALNKRIQKSIEKERAYYRAKAREAEALKRAQDSQAFLFALPRVYPAGQAAPALPALNLTPEDIANIHKAARGLCEQHHEVTE